MRNGISAALAAVVLLVKITAAGAGGAASTPTREELLPDEGFAYEAFDRLELTEIQAEGARFKIGYAPGALAVSRDRILDWVRRSAHAVAVYYGRFPVKTARILIVPVDGAAVRNGTTWGYHGAATRVFVGRDAGEQALASDWVLVHEMIHLALPDLDVRHSWLSEGIAVYVESIARVQAGDLKEAMIWHDFAQAMPKGMPKEGDAGLDNTPTWGRTYWGGAIFCLLAEIELRKRSGNTVGLQQALRAMLAKGNHEQDGTIEAVLEAGDKGTGQTVLMDLYKAMRDKPAPPDLPAMWNELGVKLDGATALLDETAPLAALRRAIVTRLE